MKPMKKQKTLYGFVAFTAVLFILHTLVKNYMIDPEAWGFLSRKTGLQRELNVPIWLKVMYVHVAFACIAMAAGLLNFSNRLFEKSRRFHRVNGYIYFVSVLVVIVTSGYMAPYATGGKISSIGFNVLNTIWLIITIAALVHIKMKRIDRHRNWMIRSYVFCYTNMLIHLITFLFHQGFGLAYAAGYTIGLYSSIVLLLIIAEIIIRKSRWSGANQSI